MPKKLLPDSFYGTTERRYELGGLTLAETVYPSGLVIPPHEHSSACLCFHLDGCCTQSWDCRSSTARPMTLTCVPAGLVHANHWNDVEGRVLLIEFAHPWLERLRGGTSVLNHPAVYEGGPLVWLSRRLVEEFRQHDDVSPLAMEGLVLEILTECSRARAETLDMRPPRWLDRVHELIRDRFSVNLSLSEIAAVAGISADHLARSFRWFHGCTIGEYVRRLRVEFACRRLATSDLSLVQVALEAGFSDQSHFTKTFKRYMRVTPAAFRMIHSRRRSRTRQ